VVVESDVVRDDGARVQLSVRVSTGLSAGQSFGVATEQVEKN
jgi:hypothetical protein